MSVVNREYQVSFDIKFTRQDFKCLLNCEAGKHDIKRRKAGIIFISLQVGLNKGL